MDAGIYVSILEGQFQQSLQFYGLEMEDVIFQQDNDPMSIMYMFSSSQVSPLTSIILNNSGTTLSKSSMSMMNLQEGYRSFGRGYRNNGTRLQRSNVRN